MFLLTAIYISTFLRLCPITFFSPAPTSCLQPSTFTLFPAILPSSFLFLPCLQMSIYNLRFSTNSANLSSPRCLPPTLTGLPLSPARHVYQRSLRHTIALFWRARRCPTATKKLTRVKLIRCPGSDARSRHGQPRPPCPLTATSVSGSCGLPVH